jgi:hypothetical protein
MIAVFGSRLCAFRVDYAAIAHLAALEVTLTLWLIFVKFLNEQKPDF